MTNPEQETTINPHSVSDEIAQLIYDLEMKQERLRGGEGFLDEDEEDQIYNEQRLLTERWENEYLAERAHRITEAAKETLGSLVGPSARIEDAYVATADVKLIPLFGAKAITLFAGTDVKVETYEMLTYGLGHSQVFRF